MKYDNSAYEEEVLRSIGSTVAAFEGEVEEGCVFRDDTYPFLGLSGEVGEVLELVKKAWRKGEQNWMNHIDQDRVIDELGDVLWYVVRCARVAGCDFQTLMELNLEKLGKRRAERGA